jgi:hypothetical protein
MQGLPPKPKIEVSISEFRQAFSDSLGIEGAEKLVADAIKDAGLQIANSYSVAEALKICEVLKTRTGFIRIVAGYLSARYKTQV